jgi:hypothetical protein
MPSGSFTERMAIPYPVSSLISPWVRPRSANAARASMAAAGILRTDIAMYRV